MTSRATIALSLALIGGCGDSAPGGGCTPGSDDLPLAASRGEGIWSRQGRAPRLVELWRSGGLREGEELAYPVALSASPRGRVAITDFQLSEVLVLEPDGTWRGAWARRGKGPGELGTPVTATWGRDGTLAIFDLTGSKVLFLTEGEPSREDARVSPALTSAIYLAGELPWAGVQPQGGILLQPPAVVTPGGSATESLTNYLLRYPSEAAEPDTLVQTTSTEGAMRSGFTLPGWPRLVAAVGSDGSIAVGGTDTRYRVTVYDSAGIASRRICRDAPPLPMSARERGDSIAPDLPAELGAALRGATLPDTPAAFGRLFWGARGRLWVQRNRPSIVSDDFLGVPGARYDIFDPDGRYLGEVTAPPAVRLQSAAGDTVFGFEVGALDETSVIAYRLVLE